MITRNLLRKRTASPWFGLRRSKIRRRSYSESGAQKPPSGHAQWYGDTLPAMVPIFLLGSAVYLALQLAQQKLSHEKFVEEASARVHALEVEVNTLQEKRASQSTSLNPAAATSGGTKTSRWWW